MASAMFIEKYNGYFIDPQDDPYQALFDALWDLQDTIENHRDELIQTDFQGILQRAFDAENIIQRWAGMSTHVTDRTVVTQ